MSLSVGTRIGPYEILLALGVGGIGEVYGARDATEARFRREAELLASLNHPNIAAVYGLEDAAGLTALVLELVEGPTLADRIEQGLIPLDEALPIGRQIADANIRVSVSVSVALQLLVEITANGRNDGLSPDRTEPLLDRQFRAKHC